MPTTPHPSPSRSTKPVPPRPNRASRWFAAVVWTLFTLAALLVLAVSGLWWWAGTDGSLATVLGWAARAQPLVATGTTGALRAGGQINTLTWQQDGLSVRAEDVRLAWQPWALLQGELSIRQLAAARVTINDQRPPTPSAGAPTSLRLPVQLSVEGLAIGQLLFTGPSTTASGMVFSASDIAGRYGFDGLAHTLAITSTRVADGLYKGTATLQADAPMRLNAHLSAAVQARLPATASNPPALPANLPAAIPLIAQLTARGALADLNVEANLQVVAPAATSAAGQGKLPLPLQPQAALKARITPWAAQPVPQADVTFQDLDVGSFVPNTPRTLLTGSASVQPLAPPAAGAVTGQFWAARAQLTNGLSGPWDQQLLPLESLTAAGQWQDGVGLLQTFKAQLGGGEVVATGRWSMAPTASVPASVLPVISGPAPTWSLQGTLQGVDPARLHTLLAPSPLSGAAVVQSAGEAIGFDINLKSTGRAPNNKRMLHLRDASANGSWNPTLAGGTLTLSALQVRTNEAALSGKLVAQPTARSGQGELTFTAPGLDAKLQGALSATSGKGDVQLRATNAAALLAWLRTLPGLPASVQTVQANGNGDLNGQWTGGWRDPTITLRLNVPQLALRLPAQSAAVAASPATTSTGKTTTTANGTPDPAVTSAATAVRASTATLPGTAQIQGLQLNLSGRLSQAQLRAQGRATLDQRRINLQLSATGGRSTAGAELATSSWQAVVQQLNVALEDPALGSAKRQGNAAATNVFNATNAWALALRSPLTLKWQPVSANGSTGGLDTGAGQASLSAPAVTRASTGAAKATPLATVPPAVIAWQPVRWRLNALATAGTVTGLPLAWAEVLMGPQLASNGLSGDLVFNADWNALLTDTLRLKASLTRSSGDLTVQATSPEGTSTRLNAGIRQAELLVTNEGDALKLSLRWDSARAGTAEGQLTTRLSRSAAALSTKSSTSPGSNPAAVPGLGGWTWPESAPLRGQLKAQLPQVGVWSVLAPPGWRLRGSLGANIAINGTRAAPQLSGDLLADDMALRSVVDGFEFGHGRLRARLDGSRLRINEFTLYGAGGPNGGGVLTAQGDAAFTNGQPQVQLNAKLTRLRASIRTDRQLTVSGDIQARLQGNAAEVTGALLVDQARIALPDEGTPQLGSDVVVRRASGPARVRATPGSPPKAPETPTNATATTPATRAVTLAVKFDLGPDFQVQGKGIDTRLSGVLSVSGDAVNGPRLLGSVNTVGGKYRAYSQRLDVEQGVLRFTGPLDNPSLDILAIRSDAFQTNQKVGVQITGTALIPRIRLYAQPELPDAEKLSWLITGKATASGGAEAALLQQAALALIGSKTGGSSGGLASSLGLDELSFKSGSSNADGTTSQAAVTLGKRFSRNFYAAYERSVSGALGTLYIFYDLSQRFTVRAQAGQQSAVDLIYTLPYD
ncbi:MAG: translocation/assembly module TamB domain-containing protein [Polaromonas sp.]|nr:translocation/assembly module TamB domain-containing protein [Polaromonas sp.]